MTTTSSSLAIFQTRYKEGYTVARLTGFIGMAVQIGAALLAAVIIVGGFIAASRIFSQSEASQQMAIYVAVAGTLLGIVFGGIFYLLGILISAQGQLILATLDTAVSSTPSLSDEEKHLVLTGSEKAAETAAD